MDGQPRGSQRYGKRGVQLCHCLQTGTGSGILFWFPVPCRRNGNITKGGSQMLNFEEELKKFQPSLEVDEIEEEALSEDLTDLSDLLKDILETTR